MQVMLKIKNSFVRVLCFILLGLVLITSIPVSTYANSKYLPKDSVNIPQMTELAKYAFSWADNTNIPYVWGGGRNKTLEEMAQSPGGTDCSGFTSAVYKHFNISITAQSSAQLREAKKVVAHSKGGEETDLSQCVPGDVVWWNGHVAIYLGDSKIVHTNTSKPPYNYPHVSSIYYMGREFKVLRMVDDIAQLGAMAGSDANDTADQVKNSAEVGSEETDSDLTGMPIQSTITESQGEVELPNSGTLTASEIATLAKIKNGLDNQKISISSVFHAFTSFLGIFLIIYGVLLVIAYAFDYSNTFIETSFLSLLTLGKLKIADSEYYSDALKKESTNKNVTYVTRNMLLFRALIVEMAGVLLVSGAIFNIMLNIVFFIYDLVDTYIR